MKVEIGKTYKTKFQTGERFTVTKIVSNLQVYGIYEKAPHIGECPLDIDRLLLPKPEENVEICKYCGKQL